MVKKTVTIDDLAVMVQRGFDETHQEIKDVKKEIKDVKKEMRVSFDKIENVVLASHQKRIEKLEAEVKELREMFVM